MLAHVFRSTVWLVECALEVKHGSLVARIILPLVARPLLTVLQYAVECLVAQLDGEEEKH